MVEAKTEDQQNAAAGKNIAILKEAQMDGTFDEITKWQFVDLTKVEEKLNGLETDEEQLDFLKFEYPCLYFQVCDVRGIDCSIFKKFCRLCEDLDNSKYYIYYIWGYYRPMVKEMKDQGKLNHGTKNIKIDGVNATYTGPLDANGNAFGEGEAVRSSTGWKYTGIFKDH